jgi:hypothetical protein
VLPRYAASTALVATALAVTAAVFLFARPQYERYPNGGGEMIDFSEVRHYPPASVREAFAAHGVPLMTRSVFSGLVTLGTPRGARTADALQVVVGPRTGTGSFGPELEPYDERFGNVLVTYGGTDERLLERVEAAVADLR